MKIIISPAKKMISGESGIESLQLPIFAERASELSKLLREFSLEELKRLFHCSEKLAQLNYGRYREMKDFSGQEAIKWLTPALTAYEGIQYQYMAPQVFTESQWEYAEKHLRILSGFYGVLSPRDGVVPYRLEMQAKLCGVWGKDLYAYWGRDIYDALLEEEMIVNLASKEYSVVVEPYLKESVQMITCIFGEKIGEKIIVKATRAKMARGAMVRFMAKRQVKDLEELKEFKELDFLYSPKDSKGQELVFLYQPAKRREEL